MTPKKLFSLVEKQCKSCSPEKEPCSGNLPGENECSLYQFKKFSSEKLPGKNRLLKAIRKFCVNCMGGSRDLISNCSSADCPFYSVREAGSDDTTNEK